MAGSWRIFFSVAKAEFSNGKAALSVFLAGMLAPVVVAGEPQKASVAAVVVPFTQLGHVPLVQVDAGSRTWNFLVDTGALISVCRPEFALLTAGTTNASARSHLNFVGDNGIPASLPVVTAPLVRLKGRAFVNVPMAVSDLSRLTSSLGIPLDGLLGFQFFQGCQWTLDYGAGELRLAPTNSAPELTGASQEYVLRNGTPCVSVELQGQTMVFMIDSGFSGALVLPAEKLGLRFTAPAHAGAPVQMISGRTESRVGRLADGFRLGGLDFIEPTMSTTSPDRYALGALVLDRFAVTFDPARQRVRFLPNQTGRVRLPAVRSTGIAFDRSVNPWNVLFVFSESAGTVRQIRPGDRCLRINGEPVSAWSRDRYENTADQTDVLHLTMAREGDQFEVDVPVYVQVP